MEDFKRQNKRQKLSSAVYLITSFFSDLEPLKWKLRTLSVALSSEQDKDKISIIQEMSALLQIAKNVNLVSDQNHQILNEELRKLVIELENPISRLFFEDLSKTEIALPEAKKEEVIKDKSSNHALQPKPLKEFGVVSVKKNSRQATIIALLKRKREIMIKDVSPLITGCSEKTIQRELLTMVSSGILRKIGEKRWSKYTLA